MTDYEFIESKIRDGMYQGNMHACLRDIGALAGGFLSAGRLSASECDRLKDLAKTMSINPRQAEREWDKAIVFGSAKPVSRTEFAAPAEFSFDSVVDESAFHIVDENWLEKEEVVPPRDVSWDPCRELHRYISALFKPDEYVEFCVDATDIGGRLVPVNCVYTLTASKILKKLEKGDFEGAVGTVTHPEAGAWIRVNPFDGKGMKDENVTDFRHCLIECDSKPVEEQVAIYKKLELPCACIVHSGGKSAHAIVKVDAADIEEYRKRVDFIYSVCSKNGLPVDKQNRNPSRYSRMPGVTRNGNKQFIISMSCGKSSFEEWEEWVNDISDNLPDFDDLCDFDNPPPLKPPVIEGILREGDKMRIAGPSKAGKSFALIELAIAVAEGRNWMGCFKCKPGKVLYIDLELNKSSCDNRFVDIYKALGWRPDHWDMIKVWHLRGKAMPLDKLAPKLIRRAKDGGFSMIVLDPIYKVLTGDENSAADMGVFCNQLDWISTECGCSIVDCHHHSKGAQGDKRSMDRASGSGVFARDPDALVDFLPLECSKQEQVLLQRAECAAIEMALDYQDLDIPPDCKVVPDEFLSQISLHCTADVLRRVARAREECREKFSASAWRLSFTVRDFATPKPINVWFQHPVHSRDVEGLLDGARAEGADQFQGRPSGVHKLKKPKDWMVMKNDIELDPDRDWDVDMLAKRYGKSDDTIWRWLRAAGYTTKGRKVVARDE